jgi:hypothetical protein
MVSGAHDKQVDQQRVKDMYADLGAPQKVFIDLACSSHNAMWEKNHKLLFQASLEWLRDGTVTGKSNGMMRMATANKVRDRTIPRTAALHGHPGYRSNRELV